MSNWKLEDASYWLGAVGTLTLLLLIHYFLPDWGINGLLWSMLFWSVVRFLIDLWKVK